jgi:hypothetical protein
MRWVYLKDYVALRRGTAALSETTLSERDWFELIADNEGGEIVDAVFSRDDPAPFVRMMESLFEKRQYYCAC